MISTAILRINQIFGVDGGKIPVSRSTGYGNYILRDENDPFIPGTNIRRLRLVNLTERGAVGAFADEVDDIIAALRKMRDAAPIKSKSAA